MTRWTKGWRLGLAIFVLATLTHLPSLVRSQALNPDEAFLATEGSVLNAGGRLYVDVVDRKPPIAPYLYATAQRVSGSTSLFPLRWLALSAHIVTALLLAALARRRWGDTAAVVAAGLYLLASAGMAVDDAQAANFEAFMLPCTVAAVLLAERGRPVAAGAAAAAAGLVKQVGLAVLAPVVVLCWRRGRGPGVAASVLSCGAVIVAVALVFGWRDFFFWNVTGNGRFVDPTGSWDQIWSEVSAGTRTFLLGSGAAVVLAVVGLRHWRDDADLWLWLAASAAGVAAGFHFFGHYYLQLLPPLALLAASSATKLRPAVLPAAAVAAVITAALFVVPAFTTRIPSPGYETLAVEVEARTAPNDPIFVWGHLPQLYWAADRPPATRFLTVGFLTGSGRGRAPERVGVQYATPGAWDELFADLAAHPPALVADISEGTFFAIDRFPAFASWLHANYHRTAVVQGVSLYERGAP
ncbi:MAG: hypothetical protein QOJ67_1981 [Acidimicrobiaceae bacterium]